MLSRVTALCSELSVEADPELPWFFDMCSPTRMIGGPNPDGRYLLAMIRGDRAYRVTGTRGTTAYLGLQVLAGHRHDAAPDGRPRQRHRPQAGCAAHSRWCWRLTEPSPAELVGAAVGPDPDGRVVDRGA